MVQKGIAVASLLVAVLFPLHAVAMPAMCPECSTQEPCGTVVSGTDGVFMYKPSGGIGGSFVTGWRYDIGAGQFVTGWRYDMVRRRIQRVDTGQFEQMTHADAAQRREDVRIDGVYWIASSLDGERVFAVASDGVEMVTFYREISSGRLFRTGTHHFGSQHDMREFMCELNSGRVVYERFGHCGSRSGVENLGGEAFFIYSNPRCSD